MFSEMMGFWSLSEGTCIRIENKLKTVNLSSWKIKQKRVAIIEFGVNERSPTSSGTHDTVSSFRESPGVLLDSRQSYNTLWPGSVRQCGPKTVTESLRNLTVLTVVEPIQIKLNFLVHQFLEVKPPVSCDDTLNVGKENKGCLFFF